MSGRDPSRFFSRGAVDVVAQDQGTRQADFRVTVPACVAMAAFPQLLSSGLIDSYEVARPLAVWIPTVADEGFADPGRGVPAALNSQARHIASSVLSFFASACRHLLFPGDLIPLLPMGTYVTFRLRCRVDDLVASLPSMVPAAGVAELRFALFAAASSLLRRWGDPPLLQALARSTGSRPSGAS